MLTEIVHVLFEQSAKVIVMEAYGANYLKKISHSWLLSAVKCFIPIKDRKKLSRAEKSTFVIPLSKA